MLIPKVKWTTKCREGLRDERFVCVLVGKRVYCLGGADCAYLSLETWKWQNVKGFPRETLYNHTATLIDDRIIVLGGTRTGTWPNSLEAIEFDIVLETFQVLQTYATPHTLTGHSAVFAEWRREIITFGGFKTSLALLCKHVHSFDVDTKTWYRLQQKGQLPQTRYGHNAVILGHMMYIHDGNAGAGFMSNIGVTERLKVADLSLPRCIIWSSVRNATEGPLINLQRCINALNGRLFIISTSYESHDVAVYSFHPSLCKWSKALEDETTRAQRPDAHSRLYSSIETHNGILYFAGDKIFHAEVT